MCPAALGISAFLPGWIVGGRSLPASLSSGAGGLPKLCESPVSSEITSAGCPVPVRRGRKLQSAPNTSSLKAQRVCRGAAQRGCSVEEPSACSTDTPHPGNHHEHLGATTPAKPLREHCPRTLQLQEPQAGVGPCLPGVPDGGDECQQLLGQGQSSASAPAQS